MGKSFSALKIILVQLLIMSIIAVLAGCSTGGLSDAPASGTTPDTTPTTSKVLITFAVVKSSDPNAATTSISPDSPAIVKATAKDSTGAVLAGKVMSFSSEFDIKFSPVSGTALTNSNGTAEITVMVGATAGAATITASINDNTGTVITNDVGITVNLQAPPAVPTGVTATATSQSQINLAWTASAGAAGYKIYKGGVLSAAVTTASTTETGLTASTQYCYSVSAYDSAGNESNQSPSACAATQAVTSTVPVPTGLTATAVSYSKVNLSWTGAFSSAKYQIYRGGVYLSTTLDTTYPDASLTANTQYCYTVTAMNQITGIESNKSAQVCVTTGMAPPPVPTGLTAVGTSPYQIDLAWSAGAGAAPAGYKIYKTGVLLKSVTTAMSTDTGLTASTQYCYTVSAYDLAGNESTKTTQACATTQPVPPPAPPDVPTGFTATAVSQSQINLSWTAVASATGYALSRGGTYWTTVQGTAASDTGLAASTQYCYTIASLSASGGSSAQSSAVCVTTPTTPPPVPTGLTVTPVSTSQLNIAWTASAGAIGYKVYRGGALLTMTAATALSDTGLAADISYCYSVSAYNATGSESAGTQACAKTSAIPAPTNLTAAPISQSRIDLSWTASAGAAGYKIYRNNTFLKNSASTSASDTGLSALTSYLYNVTAFDSANNESPKSLTVTAMTYETPPPVPSGLTVSATSPTRVDLAWTASAGAAQYKIYRDGVLLGSTSATKYADTTAVANTAYTYTVSAITAKGSESNPTAQMAADTGLTVPAGVTATVVSATQINLSWTNSGGALVTGYKVYKVGDSLSLLGAVTATSIVDAGLLSNTQYCYSVSATSNAGGESARSGAVCGTTQPLPSTEYLDLLVSSPQVGSDGMSTVTLTAIAKTANNVALKDKPVIFSSSSGTLVVVSGTTDASGSATATLSAASDKSNRTITVTATADSKTSTTSLDVTGTTLQITGQNSIVAGTSTVLSILLKDSAGKAIPTKNITLASSLGNGFSSNPVVTNLNGQADVTYTATVGGTDTITASALGAVSTQKISISSTDFTFTTPASGAEINIGAVPAVTVHYAVGGIPQAGKTVSISTTRGLIAPTSVATDGSGNASTNLSSTTAGPAIITATIAGVGTIQLPVEFVAITASSMSLQASPGTISTNTAGSTVEQSAILAVVRDASGNLVKNMTVRFSLTDVGGGYIKQASDVTNSLGTASTTYISSNAPSVKNGVRIDASVDGFPLVTASAYLTVASKPVYVVFGTGNTIENYSSTQYRMPFSALVTDIAGNPQAGVTVTTSLIPVTYLKGYYDSSHCPLSEYWIWTPALSGTTYLECTNEDNNPIFFGTHPEWLLNGVLNSGGGQTEDINGDSVLTPGNVAEVNRTATTDANGFAQFYVIYAKQFANWAKVKIEGKIYSYGDQTLGTTQFYLPVLRNDMKCDTTPPGPISPFGLGAAPNNVCTNDK